MHVSDVPRSWFPAEFNPADLPFRDYDASYAQTLLDEAGWIDSNGNGIRDQYGMELTLRLVTTERRPVRQAYQEAIRDYLLAVGIGAELSAIPVIDLIGENGPWLSHDFDLMLFSLLPDVLSPNSPPDLFGCEGITTRVNLDGLNGSGFCSKAHDLAAEWVQTTVDPADRMRYHRIVEFEMYEAAFWHGLYLRPTWYALSPDGWSEDNFQFMGTLPNNTFSRIEFWQR